MRERPRLFRREMAPATLFRIARYGLRTTEPAQLIEEKKLEPVIDRICPISGISQAFEYLESGQAKGKVVVRMQN